MSASTFECSDLNFASFLIAVGTPLTSLRREEKRVVFLFSCSPTDWATHESQWISGTAQVGARQYADAIRQLKSVIHASPQPGGRR